MTRLSQIVSSVLLAALLAGCTSFGAGTITGDKEDFTDSISESIKMQMLRNIVKLRYGDMPFFLDVKSVIKSYSLEYRLNAGVDIYPDFEPNASVGGTYADKPTISYAPLVGNDFADSIMKPIAPAFVVQLLQSGARAETIFRLLCEEINGISNRRARGGNIRAADEDFDRVVRLLQKNQDSGYMDLQVRSKEEDVLLMITQTEDSQANADVAELKRLLGLPPDQESYRMIYGLLPGESGEIALLTRSMYSILLDIAADVDIPGEDIENDRATPGFEGSKTIVAIRSGKREPEDAFIAIPYRNRWFWIDDTDIASKQVFSSVLTLFMMAGSGLERAAPVLTIPAG